jgi:hypothetical protein
VKLVIDPGLSRRESARFRLRGHGAAETNRDWLGDQKKAPDISGAFYRDADRFSDQ